MPVIGESALENINTTRFAFTPGRSALASVLASAVTTSALRGHQGILVLNLTREKDKYYCFAQFQLVITYRSAHCATSPVKLCIVNIALPLEQVYGQFN